MAKTDTADAMDKDGADAPLIDLNEASVKKLIARAKKRGYITYDEINEALPQDQMTSEQIEDIMAAISEMGVNIVENDEAAEQIAFADVLLLNKKDIPGMLHNNPSKLEPRKYLEKYYVQSLPYDLDLSLEWRFHL